MIAVDSSIVIAGFASWHECHAQALEALDQSPRLIAHASVEAYSVLTRLPAPHRAPGNLVARFLQHRFREPLLCLPESGYRDFLADMATSRILGGQVYDAVIARTVAEHGGTLISLDQRAGLIYDLMGVKSEILTR